MLLSFSAPLRISMTYFFLQAMVRLNEFHLPRWLLPTFWTLNLLVMAVLGTGVATVLNNGSSDLFRWSLQILNTLLLLILFCLLAFGLWHPLWTPAGAQKRFTLLFSANYLCFFSFGVAITFFPVYGVWVTITILGMHLPVLGALPGFLAQSNPQPPPLARDGGDRLQALYARLAISKREQEIIELVIRGLSNREIEDRLFISRRTVENHLYKVYRKLGVKNRIQLLGVLQESEAKAETAPAPS